MIACRPKGTRRACAWGVRTTSLLIYVWTHNTMGGTLAVLISTRTWKYTSTYSHQLLHWSNGEAKTRGKSVTTGFHTDAIQVSVRIFVARKSVEHVRTVATRFSESNMKGTKNNSIHSYSSVRCSYESVILLGDIQHTHKSKCCFFTVDTSSLCGHKLRYMDSPSQCSTRKPIR